MAPRICICGTQVPFSRGGAELLVESLTDELRAREFEVEVVSVPFAWGSRRQILKSALAWRLLDLTEVAGKKIDLVIATRFPSYVVRHPNKVVWLIHQFRQVYELMDTPFSDFGSLPDDERVVAMIRAMDRRCLAEARRLCTISENTAERLDRFLGLKGEALYPPPALRDRLHEGDSGDYILSVGRLDEMKRFDLLVRGLASSSSDLRCKIAGDGPERERLGALVTELGLDDRVDLLGRVDDDRLVDLYAGALGVFYAPFDEDYGYVTVEAFQAGKPVLTVADAGGVLEFVRDGENGFVSSSTSPRSIGAIVDRLAQDRDEARRLGATGKQDVAGIGWDSVIDGLTSTL